MFRALGIASALAAAVASAAAAQRADLNRIIDFHLNAERPNVSFDGSVKEGGRFRVSRAGSGTYALSMVLLNASRNLFAVTVFRGEGPGDTTTFRPLETVHATVNVPAPLTSLPYMTVVIEGTRAPQATVSFGTGFSLAAYSRRMAAGVFDNCCVTCGGITACACAVRGDCGYCCVNDCCKTMPAPPPDGLVRYFPDRPIQNGGRRCKEVPVNERIYPALYTAERIASR
jgi:hypothetical protein